MDVGLKAMYRAAKYAVPEMRNSGGGSMVNISSVHGLLVAPRTLVYETLKAGVIGLTRQFAAEYGPDGICVNAICTGHIVTERVARNLRKMTAPSNLCVGTYTRSGLSEGIYIFDHDPSSGKLALRSTVKGGGSLLPRLRSSAPIPDVACSEGMGRENGAAVSFAIDPQSGNLTWLSRQPTHGGEPCHLIVDPTGRVLLVANHEHGTVAVFPIDTDGRLAPATEVRQHQGSGPGPTQTGPHAHHVTFDTRGERALVTEKGIDQVVVYRLDTAAGKLTPNNPPSGSVHPGSAPRHLAFSKDGSFAYLNGEADMTLSVLTYDADNGAMEEIQYISTLPRSSTGTIARPAGDAGPEVCATRL